MEVLFLLFLWLLLLGPTLCFIWLAGDAVVVSIVCELFINELLPSSLLFIISGVSKSPELACDSVLLGWWKSRGIFSRIYFQYTARAATLNINISPMIARWCISTKKINHFWSEHNDKIETQCRFVNSCICCTLRSQIWLLSTGKIYKSLFIYISSGKSSACPTPWRLLFLPHTITVTGEKLGQT